MAEPVELDAKFYKKKANAFASEHTMFAAISNQKDEDGATIYARLDFSDIRDVFVQKSYWLKTKGKYTVDQIRETYEDATQEEFLIAAQTVLVLMLGDYIPVDPPEEP